MDSTRMRSAAIDGLRVIGIVAIVAGHVWSDQSNDIARMGLYTWHVPVFFFLSGYLWANERTLGVEFSKRVRTLLVPYVAWLLAIGAVYGTYLWANGQALHVGNVLLGGSYMGAPFFAFWFVTALFGACLLLRALQRFPVWLPWAVAVAGLTVAYLAPDALTAVPFSLGVAVPAMIFILAGISFRRIAPRLRSRGWVSVALLAGSAALIVTGLSQPLDMKQGDFGTPVVSVVVASAISAGLVLLFQRVFASIRPRVAGAVTRAATVGLAVVLTHSAFILLLSKIPVYMPPVAHFVIVLVVAWSLAYLLSQTPLGSVFTGAAATPARRPSDS
ncbi:MULTISPECIES: acyltransferase family protein [unclassified Cryobacterium]|uniref:acyltransferase family protein n=1 Tax=unclassified Cryobacterium TaxID=2649013 RepID=UPI00141AEE9B|nr:MULTISPECIES: acyltransferase family protein [unclassified Cryobacterium]